MIFRRKAKPAIEPEKPLFTTHLPRLGTRNATDEVLSAAFRRHPAGIPVGAMDDANPILGIDAIPSVISSPLADWYASQSFIGWQLCAVIAQHWLINKCCTMPARDATRNGWSTVRLDGEPLSDDDNALLRSADKRMRLRWNAEQFVRLGRVFGIRFAIFKVESTDPKYYENPYNPDGVTPGSYKGIVQVDPYWCAPLMDTLSSSDPGSAHFYDPRYWVIGGKKYHRSHLCIYRTAQPPDILKPMYMYGGVPVPQQIMERVYAAERVANEAPLLAQSKRTNVWLTDMQAFMAAGQNAVNNINTWVQFRDNYGIKLGDKEKDAFQQFETSLADFDNVIMTQYQIVAAAANVPATKLLGTTPKGFNSTGSYEEANYHEELESIQAHDLTPLIERHHELVLRSAGRDYETEVKWTPLDSPTALETAQVNLAKAQTGAALVAAGAISGEDEHRRVANDPDSGYDQLGAQDDDDVMADLGKPDGNAG